MFKSYLLHRYNTHKNRPSELHLLGTHHFLEEEEEESEFKRTFKNARYQIIDR